MRLTSTSLPAIVLLATSLTTISLAGFGLASSLSSERDTCSLPSGLSSTDPALVRRAMACRDLEQGRIDRVEYRRLLGLEMPPAVPPTTVVTPQWAASVRAMSTEWSATSWSAQQVLGAPDVFPAHADLPKAWASREADAASEFIEVGFTTPRRMRALHVVETFNPGAVAAVELITASGTRIQVQGPPNTYIAGTHAATQVIEFACTDEPIVGARVTLASGAIPGWNEIDAIGAIACQ